MKTNVHPLDLTALRVMATDVFLLSQRAERLGLPSASSALELVSEAIEGLYDKELIERNAAAARRWR